MTRTRRPAINCGWFLHSCDQIERGVELHVQLDRLLKVLEPVTSDLWDLVDAGYWANWWCFVGSHGTEHAVELDRELLARLLLLPVDLSIDACEPLSAPDTSVTQAHSSAETLASRSTEDYAAAAAQEVDPDT